MWNKMNIGAPSLADFYYFTVRRGFKEGVEHSIWQCPCCSLRHLKVTFVFRLCSAARQESTTREGCNPGTTLGSITIWTLPSFGKPPWPRAPSGPFSAVFSKLSPLLGVQLLIMTPPPVILTIAIHLHLSFTTIRLSFYLFLALSLRSSLSSTVSLPLHSFSDGSTTK